MSDLHLEFPAAQGYEHFKITPSAPYLALLGDIATVAKHQPAALGWLTTQLRQFRAVLFVPGNHETYHSNWATTMSILREFEAKVRSEREKDPELGEFVLLDRAVFHVPESKMVVAGCSLFSRVPEHRMRDVGRSLNDFYYSGDGWTVEAHNAAHERDLKWLNETVSELELEGGGDEDEGVKIMIVSHWSPSMDPRGTEPCHQGSEIQSAFCTDLSAEKCFQSKNVKVWAFGHTHYNCDFEVERGGGAAPLRLVTNQRGYCDKSERFDGGKTIEL